MPGTVLVVNPHSAGGKTERRWPELRATIQEAYGAFDERFTRAPGDATGMTREALRGGAELVVAVGGDGTINEVVNGFFDGESAVVTDGVVRHRARRHRRRLHQDAQHSARDLRRRRELEVAAARHRRRPPALRHRRRRARRAPLHQHRQLRHRRARRSLRQRIVEDVRRQGVVRRRHAQGGRQATRTPASASSSTAARPKRARSTTSPWPTAATSAAA